MFTAFLLAAAVPTPAVPLDRPSWFTANDYPAQAMKKGAHGTVTFVVNVDAAGTPTACHVTKSSGEPILDQTTCNIILARAHFKPGVDSTGKSAPDTYSTNVVWALPSGPPPGFHHAVIIDFTDPDHPVCRIESTASNMQGLPTCEQALAQGLGTKWLKVAALIATAPGDQTPYRGESSWGERISFLANDQFYLKGGSMPSACVSIAAEGEAAGRDACADFPGPRAISEADKKNGFVLHDELSLFAVPRPTQPHSNGCKTGETAAESLGCQ